VGTNTGCLKIGANKPRQPSILFWSSSISFLAFVIATVAVKQTKMFLFYNFCDWLNAIFLGFLGTYVYYILLYYGYAHAKGLEVLVLQYSWPIFIVALSVLLLKEKFTLRRALSVLFGFIGVTLVLSKGKFTQIHLDNYSVDILVLLAAFVFGLFSVLSKKVHLEAYTMITIYFLTATVASFISMLWLSDFSFPTKDAIIPVLVNGSFCKRIFIHLLDQSLERSRRIFCGAICFHDAHSYRLCICIIFFQEPFLPVYGFGLLAVIMGGILNFEKKHQYYLKKADKHIS